VSGNSQFTLVLSNLLFYNYSKKKTQNKGLDIFMITHASKKTSQNFNATYYDSIISFGKNKFKALNKNNCQRVRKIAKSSKTFSGKAQFNGL